MEKKSMKQRLFYIWSKRDLLLMWIYPILIFLLMQSFNFKPLSDMRTPTLLLNFVLYEVFMLLLFSLFGRMNAALFVLSLISCLWGLADYYVIKFRSAPFMPWDIYSLKTAASVAESYDYSMSPKAVLTLACFAALTLLMLFVKVRLKKGLRIRAAAILASFAAFLFLGKLIQAESSVSTFKFYDKLFTPTVMCKRDGIATAFLMQLKYITVEKPDGYHAKEAEQLLSSYENDITENTSSQTEDYPNIIIIMNEAFSDPAVLGSLETNEDYMPFVHSLMEGGENTRSGWLDVSVLGGNTANTEFEVLTGHTMAFLPQGSIPYQQYINDDSPSLASYLKELGYQTAAMHPYYATGWNRDKVYPWLGFDHTFFLEDFLDGNRLRKYIDDQSAFEKIKSVYQRKEKGKPLFLFEVTMQNHSPYDDTENYNGFTPDIEVENSSSRALNAYLSLMKESDEALRDLVEYFKAQDEKTVLVFFGDHQPTDSVFAPVLQMNGKSISSLSEEDTADRYKVPLILWANYELGEDAPAQNGLELSAGFLGLETLKTAGIPLSGYWAFLEELRDSYSVISAIRTVEADGSTGTVHDALNTYKSLQYYQLFDERSSK